MERGKDRVKQCHTTLSTAGLVWFGLVWSSDLRGMLGSPGCFTIVCRLLGGKVWTGGGFFPSWVGEDMHGSTCFKQSRWQSILHSAAGEVHTQGVGWNGVYTRGTRGLSGRHTGGTGWKTYGGHGGRHTGVVVEGTRGVGGALAYLSRHSPGSKFPKVVSCRMSTD